jgi:hypothetical protein
MPLAQVDSSGGVIITDWYAIDNSPNERFKINVMLKGDVVSANMLKVTAFKQVKTKQGSWRDEQVAPSFTSSLEERILKRAREMKVGDMYIKR